MPKYNRKTMSKKKNNTNKKSLKNKNLKSRNLKRKHTRKNSKTKNKKVKLMSHTQKGGDGYTNRVDEIIGGMPVIERHNENNPPVRGKAGMIYGKSCGHMSGGGYSITPENSVLDSVGFTPYDDGYQPIINKNNLEFK